MRALTCLVLVLSLGAFCLPVLIPESQAAQMDESLVLYLPMDEGDGDTTQDLSQYANEAVLVNNPEWVDGKMEKALYFDGSNYVQVPINDLLQLRATFTAEFWVKRDADQPAEWNYMVAAGSLKWAVIVNTDQKVYIYTDGGGWAHRLTTDLSLTEEWTHVAATYEEGKGVVVYFDGEVAGEGGEPPEVVEIDGAIMVGARNPGQEFFKGIIDEVAIYNRILSQDEIKRDMDGGLAAVTPGDKLATTWGGLKQLH